MVLGVSVEGEDEDLRGLRVRRDDDGLVGELVLFPTAESHRHVRLDQGVDTFHRQGALGLFLDLRTLLALVFEELPRFTRRDPERLADVRNRVASAAQREGCVRRRRSLLRTVGGGLRRLRGALRLLGVVKADDVRALRPPVIDRNALLAASDATTLAGLWVDVSASIHPDVVVSHDEEPAVTMRTPATRR